MTFTLQWMDAIVFLILIGLGLYWFNVRKTESYYRFKRILKGSLRCKIALWVLMIFGLIGFLDTIHFKENHNMHHTYSVLDWMMSDYREHTEQTYSPPSAQHPLGTDKVGRDVLYLNVKSIRTGLIIGTVATLSMLPFALLFGMWAGYFRGWVDDVIQYVYITLSSVPAILLIAAAMLSLQIKVEAEPELRLLILCVVLGVTGWTSLCRLLRGETLKLREMDFVQAAISLGTSHFKIILRHILPNLMHIVIISVVLDFSGLVLAEAVLSYVGVGVDPTSYSWGNLINASRLEMARDPIVWWSLFGALSFMFTLVFSANIFSDTLQEALDTRSTGGKV